MIKFKVILVEIDEFSIAGTATQRLPYLMERCEQELNSFQLPDEFGIMVHPEPKSVGISLLSNWSAVVIIGYNPIDLLTEDMHG